MSDAKHTPGPWKFEELTAQDGDGYILTEGDEVVIVHHGGAYSKGLQRDEVLANARLIAAAPDLLEALEDAREELEWYETELAGECYNNPKLNAAIAKARGE